MVLFLGVAASSPAETTPGPKGGTEGPASDVGWSYLHFHAERWTGVIDAYIRVSSIPAENVSPPPPAEWSERMPPRQEVLLVSVETKINPLFGSAVRLEDRSWLVPGSFLALWQLRSQRGGDEYEKTYWFTPDGVHRIRRAPANPQESGHPPEQSSDEEEAFYAYPARRSECTGVATPAALLFLSAPHIRPDSGIRKHLCVFDRKRLYDVLIKQGATVLPNFDATGVEGYPPGRPKATAIAFEPRSLGSAEEKEFSFLGISGDFQVVFDLNSGIPLRIQGSIPGFGMTELVLREVRPFRQHD